MKIGYKHMFDQPYLYHTVNEHFTERGNFIDETKASRRIFTELMRGLETNMLRVMMPLKGELR